MRWRRSAWLRWLLGASVARSDRTPGEGFSDRVLELLEREGKGSRKGAAKDTAESPSTALALPVRPYSPEALVALFIEQPGLSLKEYAQAFGRGAGWLSAVLANDSFQAYLTESGARGMIHDPVIVGTMEERFRALAVHSLSVLQEKLDSKEASEFLVTKAAELSVKALGMGQVVRVETQETAPQQVGAEAVADRIMKAMAAARERSLLNTANVVDVQATVVATPPQTSVETPRNGS